MCNNRSHKGHWRASSWKSINTRYKELGNGEKSRKVTFKLFKNTYKLIASLALREAIMALTLSKALNASASKTFT